MKTLLVYVTYTFDADKSFSSATSTAKEHSTDYTYEHIIGRFLFIEAFENIALIILFKFFRILFCCLNTTDAESNGRTNFIERIACMRHMEATRMNG